MRQRRLFAASIVPALLVGLVASVAAQSTAFTYQGQLKRSGSPTNGPCDFQFGLFDAATAGNQISTTQALQNVNVKNGLFAVSLDFGPNAFLISKETFFAADRWLEISVRCPTNSGTFATLSPRQQLTPAPSALFAPLAAADPAGNVRAVIDVFEDNTGFLRTRGASGRTTVLVNTAPDNPDNGFVGVFDVNGNEAASISVLDTGEGFIRTAGPNGNANVVISSLNDNPNSGFIGVYDVDGNNKAGIYVDATGKGQVFGDNKSFVVDYPNRPGAKIMYSSLEGPEAAIYHRGVVRLVKGRALIQLPEHFVALANPDSITVQLTPGSFDSEGLAVGAIHDGRIEIGELHKGHGSYDVHFVVHAVRRGYETRAPVLSADEFRAQFTPLLTSSASRDASARRAAAGSEVTRHAAARRPTE